MTGKRSFNEFDCITGKDIRFIMEYLGRPSACRQGMLLYRRESADLLILIKLCEDGEELKETAGAFILFAPDGRPLHTGGIQLISESDARKIKEGESLKRIAQEIGPFYNGIGSTFVFPAYFTDCGSVVLINAEEDVITKTGEAKLTDLFL